MFSLGASFCLAAHVWMNGVPLAEEGAPGCEISDGAEFLHLVCVRARVRVWVRVPVFSMYVCMYIHTYVCMYVYTYIRMSAEVVRPQVRLCTLNMIVAVFISVYACMRLRIRACECAVTLHRIPHVCASPWEPDQAHRSPIRLASSRSSPDQARRSPIKPR